MSGTIAEWLASIPGDAVAEGEFAPALLWLSQNGYLLDRSRKNVLPAGALDLIDYTYKQHPEPTAHKQMLSCPFCDRPDAVLILPHPWNNSFGHFECMHRNSCGKRLADLKDKIDERTGLF